MGDVEKADFERLLRRRVLILAAVFAVWGAAALLRAWYIAVPGRERFIAAGEKMARRTVEIPAVRGRIFDAAGVRLVWSERFYDLVSQTLEGESLSDEELAELKPVLADLSAEGRVLRRNLTPDELLQLEAPLKSGIRARIVSRDVRIVVSSPAIRRLAGELRFRDGGWHGASGWEAEFDPELSGTPGRLSVLLNRHRHWIPASVRVLVIPVPGRDVKLTRTLRELEKMETGEFADVK